jgi:plasmid maintenance system killer protein
MNVLAIHKDILEYLREHNLEKKFSKQVSLLSAYFSFYPSLEVELLEPKHLKIWSFRVDKKYRAIFIFRDSRTIEILDVNNHYK